MANHNQLPEHDHEHDPHLLNKRFIAHANQTGHRGILPGADGYAKGVGICGDAIEVYLSVQDNKITDIRHNPKGCTYTVACGSAMCHLACGQTLEDALKTTPGDVANKLDGLPEDHMHCAVLAVNTMGKPLMTFTRKSGARKNRKHPIISSRFLLKRTDECRSPETRGPKMPYLSQPCRQG